MVQAMDLSPTPTPTPTNTIKTPDTDTETPPEAQPTRSLSFTNGSLKRHHPQPPPPPPPTPPPPPSSMVVSYRECLKNHAASIGGHALDGCGEFMPCSSAIPTDPTSLKCAACGCHRNFHRREPDEPISGCKILSFHHHYPSPPLPQPIRPSHRSSSPSLSPSRSSSPGPTPSPHSPPPVSHLPPNSYFASPPQMLLALSTGFSGPSDEHHSHQHHHNQSFNQTEVMMKTTTENSNGRKRFRTKFSQEQKEKMHLFAEKVGWKMVKSDEGIVEEFCNEVGVGKGVLKVWMHNNKHTLGKTDRGNLEGNVDVDNNNNNNNNNGGGDRVLNNEDRKANFNLFSNGSSSSPSS